MDDLIVSTVKELGQTNDALSAVRSALHPIGGCVGAKPSIKEAGYFADGARLKEYCDPNDHNVRLQCESYIRAVADATLELLNKPLSKGLTNCIPTWQTPDQAVAVTIVYLNAHPEDLKNVPASTLIQAALLPPSCELAPHETSPKQTK